MLPIPMPTEGRVCDMFVAGEMGVLVNIDIEDALMLTDHEKVHLLQVYLNRVQKRQEKKKKS